MAFEFAYCLDGSTPIIEKITVADTVVLSEGEMVNLESGELTTAVTGDTALVGVAVEAVDNTDDGLSCAVITNEAAVYRVTDATERQKGATLDIATGALGVTTSSNADLIVVEYSTASEPTLVTFNNTHYLD
jgi:hypothetical protein